jgi:D-3-phosphoglycerate dehydrogenase
MGTILGEKRVNIARMGVGRESRGGKALMLVSVDQVINKDVLEALMSQKDFKEARFINLGAMKLKEYIVP